ncbi:thrombospondin type-1 domain-containing protein 1 isoform X2 [Denticeps clupeoides]|uniref:thrombospondin type-1 domain-containing protein 1 isoform X2 n=1 Tax=Denticeps clupeoides TaxID=299321 RepID=UPI0010A350F5|nr:thrombospondin type-1 domain-containing protein 1 isoform X2 [Denticeps clupeoides]
MTRGSASLFPFLLVLMGYAMASLQLWPSVHVALSNGSVFVEHSTDSNATSQNLGISLVDVENNETVLTRQVPFNQSAGTMEFDCSSFPYAGNFRFRAASNITATQWWSPVLQVSWPTFHIAVERASNRSTTSFQIAVSTNDHFHACPTDGVSNLLLEVSYLEYNQIGKNSINKIRVKMDHEIQAVRTQSVVLNCAFPFTERDYIRVVLKSPHTLREIKSSGPLYLSRIFPYKLLVDSIYRSGCTGTVAVRLVAPPCAFASGKVVLLRDGASVGTDSSPKTKDAAASHLALNWLTQEENETEFNCSLFDPGKNKYCFQFVLNYSHSRSTAQTCIIVQRKADEWGPWQSWSGCSVTCGEGVRERARECLSPPGGGMQCTGMVKEQSHCSLEDCAESPLGGNMVAVTGISLCLVVILATILITVWRKVCHTPKCNQVHRGSMHSPGGRKNSDEASICGHSLQRPSFSESLQATTFQKVPPHAGSMASPTEGGGLGHKYNSSLSMPLPQDPERMSPSGQKIMPPIFGYRLAQQQLKDMKKKGLKEDTKVYHVSQSPIDDTMLATSVSTPTGLTPISFDTDSQDDSNLSPLHQKSPFPEGAWVPKTSATLPDRFSPKVDLLLGPPSSGFSARKRERTADWVEMVERSGVGYSKYANFRRTSSFHDSKQNQFPITRPFRERSMTQVGPRQIPDGSCRTWAACEQPRPLSIPERKNWDPPKPNIMHGSGDSRRRPWIEAAPPSYADLKLSAGVSGTARNECTTSTEPPVDRHGGNSRNTSLGPERAERAEQNWSRRGPSPIQRNILARRLREATSSASSQRQRSSTFSASEKRRNRCRSLPLSGDYGRSPYSLTETEQRMMDISGYLGEDDGVEVLGVQRLT